jgi:hypothetical protein
MQFRLRTLIGFVLVLATVLIGWKRYELYIDTHLWLTVVDRQIGTKISSFDYWIDIQAIGDGRIAGWRDTSPKEWKTHSGNGPLVLTIPRTANLEVWIRTDGYVPSEPTATYTIEPGNAKAKQISIDRGIRYEGRLIDRKTGLGVPSAMIIELSSLGHKTEFSPKLSTRSGSKVKGYLPKKPLPREILGETYSSNDGTFVCWLKNPAPHVAVHHPDYASVFAQSLAAGNLIALDMEPLPSIPIRIQRKADSQPLANAKVPSSETQMA